MQFYAMRQTSIVFVLLKTSKIVKRHHERFSSIDLDIKIPLVADKKV